MVLNINRDSMAKVGFSPPTRVFEAAGAGACVVTDHWSGIDSFFLPGREILVAANAAEVVVYLRGIEQREARAIGQAMRRRALGEHTYGLRARQVHELLAASELSWAATQSREKSA
jgi:spore maturation protein CgeB